MPLPGTASRFACLPDDDEADAKVLKQKEKERKREEAKKNANNKPKETPKEKAKKEAKDLQNLAFGGNSKKKNKKKSNQKQSSPNKEDSSNFEEWKERDKVAVEDNFSAAMQEAILQSKLEYEHQQEVEAKQHELLTTGQGSQEVIDSLDKEDRKKVVKLQKKLATMSLDQFHNASEQILTSETNGVKVRALRFPAIEDIIGPHFSRHLNLSSIDIRDTESERPEIT